MTTDSIVADELDVEMNLSNAIISAGPRKRDRTRAVQYWRCWTQDATHSRHNWVSVGPALSPSTALEYIEFAERKQAVPLKQYGTFNGVKNKVEDQSEVFQNNKRFNPLIRAKAIHELARSQFIAYRWHKDPVLRAMAPDEWKLDEIEEFVCEIDGRAFNTLDAMRKHVRAMYPEANAADAVGREMAGAIKALNSNSITPETLLEVFKQSNTANAEMMAEVLAAAISANAEEVTKATKTKDS